MHMHGLSKMEVTFQAIFLPKYTHTATSKYSSPYAHNWWFNNIACSIAAKHVCLHFVSPLHSLYIGPLQSLDSKRRPAFRRLWCTVRQSMHDSQILRHTLFLPCLSEELYGLWWLELLGETIWRWPQVNMGMYFHLYTYHLLPMFCAARM